MENAFFKQLKNELAEYGESVGKVGQLRLIGLVSRVLGLFLLIFTVVLCVLALFSFISVAAINAMTMCMPVWAAALIVGSAYIVIIVLAILCRKQLFIHPFIALMSKQLIHTQEELDIETLKAEHEVEMKTVRMETRVENATRELNFYANLFTRVWNAVRRLIRKS